MDLAQRKAAAAGLIQAGLSVFQAPNSSLVSISFDSPDPGWAANIANAVAQGFTDLNLERRYGSSAYSRKFLEEKLAELKVKLEESEKALVEYQDKEQIITSKGKDQQPLADSDLAFAEFCAAGSSDRAYSRPRALAASRKDAGAGLAADHERQINCGFKRKAGVSCVRISGKARDLQTRLS